MRKFTFVLLLTVLIIGCFVVSQGFVGAATATTEEAVRIVHGPYLLGVTKNSIRIMWETDRPADSTVEYGLSDSYGKTVETIFRRGNPVEEIAPEGISLYEAVITGLEADTIYNYRVTTGSTSSENSTFKTLPGDGEPFKFIAMHDSHLFTIAEEFTKRALDYQPDFILHAGDIPEGYGFQYDQFAKYWFAPGEEFLRQIPVFYTYGNHDVGIFWENFFSTQALGLTNYGGTPLNPRPWFSFNVGNAHFIVLDSNEFSPMELEKWEEEREWLIEDLESDDCKNATWRFIVEHHPYTSSETREYIIPITEKYDIDFLLTGHSHAYYKIVSINPEIGTGNMFLNVGAGKAAEGRVSEAPPPPRRGYPNIIAYGRSDYGTFEVNGDTVTVRIHSTLPEVGEGPTGVLDEFVLVKEKPKFEYTNLEISPDSIEVGEAITIKTTVKNVGRGLAAVALKIYDNGEPIVKYVIGPEGQERVIVLEPGESEEIEVALPLYDVGKHKIEVVSFAPQFVNVSPLIPTFIHSDMKVNVGENLSSDTIIVTAMVQNVGSFTETREAKLYVDGEAVGSKSIILDPKGKTMVTFLHKFAESGPHLVNVGDLEPVAIEIQGTLALTPIVPDLSGFGNNGIMRGDSKWVEGVVGKAVDFDGVDDYIEVPDSESLHITDEFTAIVWGNVTWLDTEKNHSASLLVKGPSTGWGPTYLIRMIFRGTGGFTSGTCYDGVEFAWEGGWLNPEDIGKWRQYISTYEKPTSAGYSYINLEKVAESVGGGTPLNYWEGYPLMIGLAYAGYTDNVFRRGTVPFLLNGKVDEIRFYNVHLSEDERRYIYEHPEELGPRSENLVLWLSFDEVESQGTHILEWRQPIAFVPSYVEEKMLWTWDVLEANASIPEGAMIEATIQVSDDGKNVKDSKKVALKDGVRSYDISDLEPAQYIRIVTEFDTTITDSVIPIPKLEKYAVTASVREAITEVIWSTRADWEKGMMSGAIGFEPVGRLKVVQ